MAPSPRRHVTPAEVSLGQLRNCFANLPQALVTTLANADTPAQNVIVELQYRSSTTQGSESRAANEQRSIYLGWSGMASSRASRSGPMRNGVRLSSTRDSDPSVVEIDATFGRMLGLAEGQKVGISVHLDPPLAHTVNIEPLTPGDWEIIELHPTFLEINLISQIRALPNPAFVPIQGQAVRSAHPLTLHLSPTSTANIVVTLLVPAIASSSPFAKLAPDAEVIVAPKMRPKLGKNLESRSIASTGRSAGGRSRTNKTEPPKRKVLFLRGVDQSVCPDLFDEDDRMGSQRQLIVWLDKDAIEGQELQGAEWISISIVRPPALEAPSDAQALQQLREQEANDSSRHATRLVARLREWYDAPDMNHVALSPMLCACLGSPGLVGGLVRLEAAPVKLSSSVARNISLHPFGQPGSRKIEGFKFGAETMASREAALERVKSYYSGLLNGPITDGMILPAIETEQIGPTWNGGIIRFKVASQDESNGSDRKTRVVWSMIQRSTAQFQIQADVLNPYEARKSSAPEPTPLPKFVPELVGIDSLLAELHTSLRHQSSILLHGGQGSGKTSIAHLLAFRRRREALCHTAFFPCQQLLTDETRVATIKEILTGLFRRASWGSRNGGQSLIILDDLDKICPAEQELQVGNDNERSRQVSHILCSIMYQYAGSRSSVVVLITSHSQDALNSIIIGAHVVRDIVNLKAPDKEGRRAVLDSLTKSYHQAEHILSPVSNGRDSSAFSQGSDVRSRRSSTSAPSPMSPLPLDGPRFILSEDLEFLDIAGMTDGYMPGDLSLLLSRAQSECLIRTLQLSSTPKASNSSSIAPELTRADFISALSGFTPASLRNVTLQYSTTTFASIGGLHSTRKTLLETLQYPTIYAPIFASCPLRLRSGLLLYGYPGCGKTLLASAVAGECGLNFISVKGPEILNKYIGASEKSVRDLFDRAEAARPCVLFFDEFDSIAPKRGHDSTGVTDRVVNQLLTQMDGAEGLSGVYVLAATSRPDLIDPALLRPGRLDKSLLCDMPGFEDRLDILRALAGKLKISENVLGKKGRESRTLVEVARRTEGYSGADLQAVVYNAHLEAIHDVLGDRKGDGSMPNGNDTRRGKARKPRPWNGGILTFKMSDTTASEGLDTADKKTEPTQAALVAKLEEIALVRKKEKETKRALLAEGNQSTIEDGAKAPKQKDSGPEVIIEWSHIERSLATTRPSISVNERRKLDIIYREFVQGRSGEMGDGEGTGEWGGRSSLM
ncbi:Peroxisome biosynthesis protein pex1 [Agyrium rufum]|nr:Peroxisome biosynthesis protein pex1 [Agyrium rufum]